EHRRKKRRSTIWGRGRVCSRLPESWGCESIVTGSGSTQGPKSDPMPSSRDLRVALVLAEPGRGDNAGDRLVLVERSDRDRAAVVVGILTLLRLRALLLSGSSAKLTAFAPDSLQDPESAPDRRSRLSVLFHAAPLGVRLRAVALGARRAQARNG